MGSLTLSELLDQAEDDEVVGKMKVLAVLESLPGVGKVKARRTMEEIGIAETRRLRGLGKEQRASCSTAFSWTRPLLVTISGLPGSGTSTVAARRRRPSSGSSDSTVGRGLPRPGGRARPDSPGRVRRWSRQQDPGVDLELDARLAARAAEPATWSSSRRARRGWIATNDGAGRPAGRGSPASRPSGPGGWPTRDGLDHRRGPRRPTVEREASEAARYLAYYGIDLADLAVVRRRARLARRPRRTQLVTAILDRAARDQPGRLPPSRTAAANVDGLPDAREVAPTDGHRATTR